VLAMPSMSAEIKVRNHNIVCAGGDGTLAGGSGLPRHFTAGGGVSSRIFFNLRPIDSVGDALNVGGNKKCA